MNSKQECIAKAYGEYWEEIKEFIDENGYFDNIRFSELKNYRAKIDYTEFDINDEDFYVPMYRPKSLQGIENNNGWIKIDSEEDLPKFFGTDYWVMLNSNVNMLNYNMTERNIELWKKHVTHYQPITKPEPPIY